MSEVAVYQLVGGPYDGEHKEIDGSPLAIRFPVLTNIQLCTIVSSSLPVTQPRDFVHEYTLEYRLIGTRRRIYEYVYRGIKEIQ